MTPKEAFKAGFLIRCAEEGLSDEATHERIKTALFDVGSIMRGIGSIGSAIAGPALLTGVGLPIVAGVTGGHLAAKAVDDDSDVNEAKTDEILAEYRRLADQARRQTAMKQMRGLPTLGGLPGNT